MPSVVTPLRVIFAIASVVAVEFAIFEIAALHSYRWVPIGVAALLLLVGGAFEAGRYRQRLDRSSPAWRPTGEKFVDPSTGRTTTVFYDPVTGKRDYRG